MNIYPNYKDDGLTKDNYEIIGSETGTCDYFVVKDHRSSLPLNEHLVLVSWFIEFATFNQGDAYRIFYALQDCDEEQLTFFRIKYSKWF